MVTQSHQERIFILGNFFQTEPHGFLWKSVFLYWWHQIIVFALRSYVLLEINLGLCRNMMGGFFILTTFFSRGMVYLALKISVSLSRMSHFLWSHFYLASSGSLGISHLAFLSRIFISHLAFLISHFLSRISHFYLAFNSRIFFFSFIKSHLECPLQASFWGLHLNQ